MKPASFLILLLILATHASAQKTSVDSTSFATVVFYRAYIPPMQAPVKKAPIYINDTLVHRLTANTIFTQKIYSERKFNISIDYKDETPIPMKLKFRGTYYFKCDVADGLWFGKPVIRAVPPLLLLSV